MSFWEKRSKVTLAAFIGSITLLAGSIISSQQQIPTLPQTTEIYDSKLVAALKNVQQTVPEGQKICVSSNSPQVTFFTNRFAQIPWNVNSEKSLLQYMLLRDYSYLLVYENKSSESKIYELFSSNGATTLERNFERISSQTTDTAQIDLYHVRPNITLQNLPTIFDNEPPTIRILTPANSTVIKTNQSGVALINVSGTAQDQDSRISKVELKVGSNSSYDLAKPIKALDWSRWSYSIVLFPGNFTIIARATDNAGNVQSQNITIEIETEQNTTHNYYYQHSPPTSFTPYKVNKLNGNMDGYAKVIPSTTTRTISKQDDNENSINQARSLDREAH